MKTKVSLLSALSVLSLAATVSLGGCAGTDIVAKVANSSFKNVIDASAGRVGYSEKDSAWALASTAGDQVLFSSDFASADGADVTFSFDAAPFLAAGLDPAKLSLGEGIKNELKDSRLTLRFDLGKDKFAADAKKSLEATFAEIVRAQRQRIGYHEKLDHYGIKLGGGNMFEWAKDMATNDKDTVWVLNPGPFIAAGVDPAKVAGWVFAKVESKDANGKTQVEDKLLKPFNLR